jgi:methionyl-tRNA formyltransferase
MGKKLKIYGSNLTDEVSSQPGLIEPLGKDRLIAHCADYLLNITDVQYEGKKRMPVKDFLNGLKTT